jgi:SAM-dependent methyltransferase
MDNTNDLKIPAQFFERVDQSADEQFYIEPRFVAHIDEATIDALTDYYRHFIPPHSRVLDLMSSWISHLPEELELDRVAGLGMNEAELSANPRLTDFCVHNLNKNPQLPYEPETFDRVTLAVSVQYLIEPFAVMSSVSDVLTDGGAICIAMSHRLFPTKAVQAFQQLQVQDRIRLVGHYLEHAGFRDVEFTDRSPPGADPLWLVSGYK